MSEPRISVVTSCRNAEAYVEATIRSVVQQGYAGLEYIFIDAASTDGTLEIARRYQSQIAAILSEPDAGQYHGIQKGLNRANGDVLAWLNGDDLHCPWTLRTVGEIFAQFPDVDWIIGTPAYADNAGACVRISAAGSSYPRTYIRNGWFRPEIGGYLQQEGMFWRRSLWERAGGLNLELADAADFDLWRRFAEHADLISVSVPLGLFRQLPGEQRSSLRRYQYESEVRKICRRLPAPPRLWEIAGSRSEILRHLVRMLVWKRAETISYSPEAGGWVKTRSLRPVARTSWTELLLERAARRAASR